jgi:hypothetical protein
MSFAALEIPSHAFGHTMVDAMARPLNTWVHEPYHHHSRHAPYYPQEHPGHSLRLPPPSSLVTGTHSHHSLPSGREPTYKHNAYPDPYAAASPVHHTSTQLATPTSEPYVAVSSITRRREDISARLSPALSSTASERSDDLPDPLRLRQLVREQSSSQAHRLHPPIRQIGELSPELRRQYPEVQAARGHPPTPGYRSRDVRLEQQPHLMPSPSHSHTWSPKSEPRAPERMKISDLLSNEPRTSSTSASKAPMMPVVLPTSPQVRHKYSITVRQQPAAARSCGFGERDRRVVDPPPIVELTVNDPSLTREEINDMLRHQYSVMHCTIWDETGKQDCSQMPEDYRQQRRLMGTIVASPFVGFDENDQECCFFTFPDLSCRTPGSFRLKFSLVVLDAARMVPGSRTPICSTTTSDVFTVYNAKDFPGMQASTPLTKRLKEQGCLISIKKGNDKAGSSHARDDSDDDDEDNDDQGSRRKRQRKS